MAEPELLATATMEFARSADTVRKEFLDVDHAVRDRIYHGAELSFVAPPKPGERRLRQTVKILGRTQQDDFVVEQGEGGTYVRRFVDGANVGVRFVGRFFDGGPHASKVQLASFVPESGYVSGLGKLSRLGMEKALEKILGDHKRALEGYQPQSARGTVNQVLAALKEIPSRLSALGEQERAAVVRSMIEGACLIAVCDATADDSERDALRAVVTALRRADPGDDEIDALIGTAFELAHDPGVAVRCDLIGKAMAAANVADLGLSVAALVALASRGVGDAELAAMQKIAAAAGVSEIALNGLIRRVDRERA